LQVSHSQALVADLDLNLLVGFYLALTLPQNGDDKNSSGQCIRSLRMKFYFKVKFKCTMDLY
jgi:hypothetical protein